MFRFPQFLAYAVDVHDPLRGVVVPQDLCVEFADTLRLALCDLVTNKEPVHFIAKLLVRFPVSLGVC